jgi:hypothetical protein
MKNYYIVYFYENENGSGVGSSTAIVNGEIYTQEKIEITRREIINKNGYKECVILNIIPLIN